MQHKNPKIQSQDETAPIHGHWSRERERRILLYQARQPYSRRNAWALLPGTDGVSLVGLPLHWKNLYVL